MTSQVATQGQGESRGQVMTLDDLPLAHAIAELKDKFAAALPKTIPVERFLRIALLAVTKAQVAKAAGASVEGRRSVYNAMLQAATDGLLLDGRDAALVVYSTKVNKEWVELVQYQPMVAGIRKKARNSGEIEDIICQVRYANDHFDLDFVAASGPPIVHRLPDDGVRGEMIGAYALVKFRNGSFSNPEYMDRDQIEQIKRRTRAKNGDGEIVGPWATDEAEMWRKTVLKRAAKSWPSSTDRDGVDLEALVRRDDVLTDLTTDHSPTAPPTLPRKQPTAARMLTQETQKQPPQDAGNENGSTQQPQQPKAASSNDPPDDFSDV